MLSPASASSSIRVAIVEDHQLLTASLSAALEAEGHRALVAPMSSLKELKQYLHDTQSDVTLLDLDLGLIGSGTEVLPGAVAIGSKVIVVSGTADEAEVGECVELGAYGWVPKSASYDELLSAVLAAAMGEPLFTDSERDRLLRRSREKRELAEAAFAPFSRLSRREGAVLAMLVEGKPVDRIAAESFVSEATVRTQVRGILLKLGVNSQLEAVAMATRAGWRPDER